MSEQQKILYLDCFSGLSGDMLLAAMLDLGLEEAALRQGLAHLPVTGFSIAVDTKKTGFLHGKHFSVSTDDSQPHRAWRDIQKMVQESDLPETVKQNSLAVLCFQGFDFFNFLRYGIIAPEAEDGQQI